MSTNQTAISVRYIPEREAPYSSCNKLHGLADRTPSLISHCIGENVQTSLQLQQLLEGALSQSSKNAYQSDLRHFFSHGGTVPCSPEEAAEYVARLAGIHKTATIARRLVSIGKAHQLSGYDNPVKSDIVKLTMRGLRRSLGSAQRQAKPVLKEGLFVILEGMGEDLKSLRDKALLLLCFAGGFRRSEVVSLDVEDIEHVCEGIIVRLARSKTDQNGNGRKIAIPHGRGIWCPIRALKLWISACGLQNGPLFRVVNRHGQMLPKRLSGQAVSIILKSRASSVGANCTNLSGHSLRAGFVTSAALAGVSSSSIRKQTGHRSDGMLNRYIRDTEMFKNNATAAIF